MEKDFLEDFLKDLGGMFGGLGSPISEREKTSANEIDVGYVALKQEHNLAGDRVYIESITLEQTRYLKISFPRCQSVKIVEGTRGAKIRYHSPAENGKRIIPVAYLNGRCRIVLPR